MARHGSRKAINVKIATSKVIKALEDKLAQIKKDYANKEANDKKFEKAKEKWNKEVVELALTQISKAQNIRVNLIRFNNSMINIDFDIPKHLVELPTEPEREHEAMSPYEYQETTEEIENAIRILKMTDEEVISTSTYDSIARYL
jgi:hypothetical protein